MSLRLLPARTLIAASRAASLRTASVIAAQRGFASLTKRLPPASTPTSTPASTPASASASKPNNDKEENELSNRAKFRQISPSSQLMQRLDQHGYGLANLAKRGGWQKLRARVPEVFVKFPALGFIAGAKQASSFPPEKATATISIGSKHTSGGGSSNSSSGRSGSIGKSVPEVAFIGRSNVGKSTLINALGETPHLAKVSSKPGYTQQINFYAAPDNDFNVVDMPGYGFAYANTEQSDSWLPLIEEYLSTRKTLKLLFLLIDARHGIKRNDAAFIEMLERPEMMGAARSSSSASSASSPVSETSLDESMQSQFKAKYQIVLTKCDLVPRLDLARRYMILEETIKNLHGCLPQILMVSNGKRHAGMNDLRKVILHTVGCGRKYLAGVKHKEKLKELDRLAENERKEQSKRKARAFKELVRGSSTTGNGGYDGNVYSSSSRSSNSSSRNTRRGSRIPVPTRKLDVMTELPPEFAEASHSKGGRIRKFLKHLNAQNRKPHWVTSVTKKGRRQEAETFKQLQQMKSEGRVPLYEGEGMIRDYQQKQNKYGRNSSAQKHTKETKQPHWLGRGSNRSKAKSSHRSKASSRK